MPDGDGSSPRERFARLDAALSGHPSAADRARLKADIIDLYRSVDREIAELAGLKDAIRGLVTKWKALDGPGDGHADRVHDVAPAPTRTDHLNASSHIEKGWSLIALGEYAAAEQVLTQALALVPGDPQASSLLGWAQMLQEKHDQALGHFHRVLEREPTNALARVNVGYICLRKGIVGEAIEHLSRAIRLGTDPKATLYAHLYLGRLYAEREMYADAESFLRKAIALGPNLIEAYFELGLVRWNDGRVDGAREAWREGVAANKFSPWGKRCAEMLQRLEAGGVPAR